MIHELKNTDTGMYLITTQGSVHLWNLDEGWYIRNPNKDKDHHWSMSEFPNGRKQHWVQVGRYPEVGSTFLVYLSGDYSFHRSSTIKSIVKVD